MRHTTPSKGPRRPIHVLLLVVTATALLALTAAAALAVSGATTFAGGNGDGSAANQLSWPAGVAVDGDGNLYVADQNNHRVQMFPPGSTSATEGITVAGGNGYGPAANQLGHPADVAFDTDGNLYVADQYNMRVQMFPPGFTSATEGTTVAGGNGEGSAADQFAFHPAGVRW